MLGSPAIRRSRPPITCLCAPGRRLPAARAAHGRNRTTYDEPGAGGSLWTMETDPLRDGHGRRIGDLRVSVTDRCNFRCQYCMPAEGLPWLERAEILGFEEITRIVS